MADENLEDYQQGSSLPPGGNFGFDEDPDDDQPFDRGVQEDKKRNTDWQNTAKELRKQTGGGKPKSDTLAPQSAAAQAKPAGAGGAQAAKSAGTASGGAASAAGAKGVSAGKGAGSSSGAGPSGGLAGAAGSVSGGGGPKPQRPSAQADKAQSASGSPSSTQDGSDASTQASKNQTKKPSTGQGGGVKGKAMDAGEQVANQAGDAALRDISGGTVGGNVGTIARDTLEARKEEGYISANVTLARSALNNISFLGLTVKQWILIGIGVQLLCWAVISMVIGISVIAVCEAASYKVFGVDIGLKAGGVITGLPVEALCGQVNTFVTTASSGRIGSISQPGAACSPLTSGPASLEALSTSCFGPNAAKASGIARQESGGNPAIASRSDVCQPGGESVSWGLFQINISANKIGGLNCPAAFSDPYTGSDKQCTVVNRALYDQCVAAAKDPAQNIQTACRMSGGGANWGPWGANRICKF